MLAYRERGFPVTVIRLPMVNGPILIPEVPHLELRHVYGGDVLRGIAGLATTDVGVGEARRCKNTCLSW
jgi:hypothetical protein